MWFRLKMRSSDSQIGHDLERYRIFGNDRHGQIVQPDLDAFELYFVFIWLRRHSPCPLTAWRQFAHDLDGSLVGCLSIGEVAKNDVLDRFDILLQHARRY